MSSDAVLTQILAQLQALQVSQQTLQAQVCRDYLEIIKTTQRSQLDVIAASKNPVSPLTSPERRVIPIPSSPESSKASLASATPVTSIMGETATDKEREKLLYPGRVNLTSACPTRVPTR